MSFTPSPSPSHCGRFLAWIDGFLCLFIFFPLAILHWRGTWGLQDVYIYPSDEAISGWISLAIGTVGCIGLALLHGCIFTDTFMQRRLGTWVYVFASRFYMYVSGWFVMAYWRGVWDLVDFYLTTGWVNSVVILIVCQLFTFVTKTSRNNVGLPFSISLDTHPDILQPDTLFDSRPFTWKFFLDVVYGQLIVVTSGILVWRGIWNVFDNFLFPDDMLLSDLVSLVLGYLLCIQLFLLQWPAGITSTRLDDFPPLYKILFEDLILFVASWANLLLWRGGWDLCVAYFIPDPMVGGWISHWIGTIGLIALQGFNSVALNGLERDGQFKGGDGVFPTSYLRVLLKDHCGLEDRKDDSYSYLIRDAADVDDVAPYRDNVTDVRPYHDVTSDVENGGGDELCLSDDDVYTHTAMTTSLGERTNGDVARSSGANGNGYVVANGAPRHSSSGGGGLGYTVLSNQAANGSGPKQSYI